MKKRVFAIIVAMALLLGAMPVFAAAPVVESIEYEGKGCVEIDFRDDVKYKNLNIKVVDEKGAKYAVTVTEKDDDELKFKIKSPKAGRDYRVVITGIKERGTSGYGKVKAAFSIPAAPAATPVIEDIEVNGKGRIEVDFKGKVQYKNLAVKVKDVDGKKYAVKILGRDSDEINIKAAGLAPGTKYTLVITGIRQKGATNYGKVKTTFITPGK